uniref:Uncharacterized protein n=1 Tax=Anopheles melas TaxID=34690 RepID=A0A182TVH8_9DIPT
MPKLLRRLLLLLLLLSAILAYSVRPSLLGPLGTVVRLAADLLLLLRLRLLLGCTGSRGCHHCLTLHIICLRLLLLLLLLLSGRRCSRRGHRDRIHLGRLLLLPATLRLVAAPAALLVRATAAAASAATSTAATASAATTTSAIVLVLVDGHGRGPDEHHVYLHVDLVLYQPLRLVHLVLLALARERFLRRLVQGRLAVHLRVRAGLLVDLLDRITTTSDNDLQSHKGHTSIKLLSWFGLPPMPPRPWPPPSPPPPPPPPPRPPPPPPCCSRRSTLSIRSSTMRLPSSTCAFEPCTMQRRSPAPSPRPCMNCSLQPDSP